MVALKNVALRVPDLRAAEGYYRAIFAGEVVGREVRRDDGRWYQLRPEHGWDDLAVAGLEAAWVGLRRDDPIIALFKGDPDPARSLDHIGVVATAEEAAAIRARLPDDVDVEPDDGENELTFVDRYGFRWQLSAPGFDGAGIVRGDWLDL